MTCPLCEAKKITEWKHEDNVCWIARCSSHRDKWIIVLKRHAPFPTPEEHEHMMQLAEKLFPAGTQWRGPNSIKDHWHFHSV
jgi:hypothetical protein